MKKKVMSLILVLILMSLSVSNVISAASPVRSYVLERTANGNIDSYHIVTLRNSIVEVPIGNIPQGKILVISAIPEDGSLASRYVKEIGLYPAEEESRGLTSAHSLMRWCKIGQTANYSIRVRPQNGLEEEVDVAIYTYTVNSLDGFTKYDAVEGISGEKNYVVSNKPEMLGYHSTYALENSDEDLLENRIISEKNEYEKTILIDGTERMMLKPSSTVRIVSKNPRENSNSNKKILDSEEKKVFEKLSRNEKLSIGEFEKYNEFFQKNNLSINATSASVDTSQLGEYGYYLSKSKINGNANVFWEHVNKTGTTLYYGILLQNTSSSNIRVKLNKRSMDSTDESGTSAMASVWSGFFNAEKESDVSDLNTSTEMVIAPNSAKWVALYLVTSKNDATHNAYNIFTGQVSLSIKNSSGQTYVGNDVYCYSFLMTNWANPSTGQQMYKVVQNSIGNGTFTRANGAEASSKNSHISGTGNGARLLKSVNSVIDITNDRYSFLITGLDLPHLNTGELMSLFHDGPPTGGGSGYAVENGCNYGVIYKISFNGFDSTVSTQNIRVKLKYSRLTNTAAVESNNGGIFATVVCPGFLSQPANVELRSNSSQKVIDNLTIPQNTPFDLYIVVGGMSSLPLEVTIFAE